MARSPDSLARSVGRFLLTGRPLLARWARDGYFSAELSGLPRAKVLLIACHWIGDTFWARQVLAPLRATLPPDALWVATRPRSRELWSDLIPPERLVLLDHVVSDRRREGFAWGGLWRESAGLREEAFDLILDLSGNRYSALMAFLARPARAYGCGGGELARLYSANPPDLPPAAHLALRPWHAVAPILGQPPAEPPRPAPLLEPKDADPTPQLAELGLAPDADYLLLAPGAGWGSKQWPVARYAELAARLEGLGLEVLATGAPREQALLEHCLARTIRGRVVRSSLREFAALAARARLLVANDSGLGHLAAAQGTPVLALFSSSNPARYRPLGPRVRVLRGECPYRPEGPQETCHDDPNFPCPANCWDALTVERVVATCRRMLIA